VILLIVIALVPAVIVTVLLASSSGSTLPNSTGDGVGLVGVDQICYERDDDRATWFWS